MNIQCISYHIMIMIVIIITISIIGIISVVLYSGFMNLCAVLASCLIYSIHTHSKNI